MATVEIGPDGKLYLNDPVAFEVMQTVNKHNCTLIRNAQQDRIDHFRNRAVVLGYTPADVVILLANVDDARGNILAEATMPGHDWQQYRDKGEIPFARGLAGRDGVLEFIKQAFNQDIDMSVPDHVQVVVIDYDTFIIE